MLPNPIERTNLATHSSRRRIRSNTGHNPQSGRRHGSCQKDQTFDKTNQLHKADTQIFKSGHSAN